MLGSGARNAVKSRVSMNGMSTRIKSTEMSTPNATGASRAVRSPQARPAVAMANTTAYMKPRTINGSALARICAAWSGIFR